MKTKTSQAEEVMKGCNSLYCNPTKDFCIKCETKRQTMLSCYKEEEEFLEELRVRMPIDDKSNKSLTKWFYSYFEDKLNDLTSAIKVLEGVKT